MTESLDQSAYMMTYTGRRFYLYNPTPDQVNIIDIAHALSMLCRFTGHTTRFYSVAQHCWHASYLVPTSLALEALLHDAAEAYVNDLSRPLKHHSQMQGYRSVEDRVDLAIRSHFNLPTLHTPRIKTVDNCLVVTEAKALLTVCDWTEGHADYPHLDLPALSPAQAERRFLSRYADLAVKGVSI
jgi:5'-deoxynucleotidase YfbR-like HD superfamily hydrolase